MPDYLNGFDYDAELAACAAGDQSALRRLYDQEGARLLGVARRIVRDTALAEDIVHDAFIKIWTGAGSFDPLRGAARGWLYTVTRHLALNAVRDNAREIGVDDATAVALDAHASMAQWADATDSFAWQASPGQIAICMEQLEPVRRNCLLHAYVDGLSHREIAERVAAPAGTVKSWIKRSLASLKLCLS
ncbi:MAG: sigma-70 family RNA polymerase sigma factor [Pseudomonadota bacterium]|nr:sigma-70 family RNA polymerase sigma factor [Pseudomonadota bacterium]